MALNRRKKGTTTPRMSGRLIAGLLAGAILLIVAVANGHLVYVAVKTAPDCVAHAKAGNDAPGTFRAAKSAC